MAESADPDKVAPPAELADAERRLAQTAAALAALPRGCLVRKTIKGRPYYYLAYREGARVRFEYLGKLSAEEAARHTAAGKTRAGLKREMTRLRGRIAGASGASKAGTRSSAGGRRVALASPHAKPAGRELDRNLL